MIEKLLEEIKKLTETRRKEYRNASARLRFYWFKYKNVENVEWYKASFALMICLFISELITLFMKPSAVDPFCYRVIALCFIRIFYSAIYNAKYKYFIRDSEKQYELALYRLKNTLYLQQRAIQGSLVEDAAGNNENNKEFIDGLYDGIKSQYEDELGTRFLS